MFFKIEYVKSYNRLIMEDQQQPYYYFISSISDQ